MFSKFFIDRPIFATVVSLVFVLAGLVSMKVLPIEQYPNIVPTEIQISATYPGATAEVLADTVAAMDTDVVVSFGAGNIDACCGAIAEKLKAKS